MTDHDDLRRGLDDVAATIDIGDLDLATVRTQARRRRRRVQLTAGLGVAALVAGATVAVVAISSDDEPDRLATADVEESETSSPSTSTAGDEEPDTTELSTAPAQTVRVIDRPGVPGQVAGVDGAPEYGEWTAPWQDGFLVGSLVFAPQPLPAELPEEVTALFPQEVRDLFGGELPPTIAEATEMLREAGLLETVTEIILANPEASDAIYSVPTPEEPPTLDVRFTTDGTTWEPIEMVPPPGAGYIAGATAVGDRLVVWYGSQGPLGDVGDGTVRVASTFDLVNWNVQEIVVPPPWSELPAGITWSVHPFGFAANESGWVASVSAGIDFDPFELVPADVRAELEGSSGYGFGTDDTGITIDVDGAEDITYTWDELGVAPEFAEYLGDRNYLPTTWAAAWDGLPAPSETPGPADGMIATPAGFVALGSEMGFSVDGLTWSTSPLPFEDAAYVTASFVVDGGIIALVDSRDGAHFYRLDERGGSPERLDIPGLPATARGGFGPGGRGGVVLDATDPGPPPPPIVLVQDGYRLTIDHVSGVTEVVELASGEVVGSLDVRDDGEDGPITWDIGGLTVTDPATGDVVVVFPADDIEAASEEAFQILSVDEQYDQDLWLLASADGETFVVDDLDDSNGDLYFGPSMLTANGSRLLLQEGGTWVVYDLR